MQAKGLKLKEEPILKETEEFLPYLAARNTKPAYIYEDTNKETPLSFLMSLVRQDSHYHVTVFVQKFATEIILSHNSFPYETLEGATKGFKNSLNVMNVFDCGLHLLSFSKESLTREQLSEYIKQWLLIPPT